MTSHENTPYHPLIKSNTKCNAVYTVLLVKTYSSLIAWFHDAVRVPDGVTRTTTL